MWHPSPEELARLVDEAPTPAEAEHLAACADCAAELAAMRAEHDALAALLLHCRIILEQCHPGALEVRTLRNVFSGRLGRNRIQRPDLTVRMRVRAPHQLALVLEHLDPGILSPELAGLIRPGIDHVTYLRGRHLRERQIVARRKADDATGAAHWLLLKQVLGSCGS